MNAILNEGFVSPYINFNFETGSIEPLNLPPSYFMSLVNSRTTDKACSFTLTIMYAPGNASEYDRNGKADLIHQILLSSVNKTVTYGYGYITPGGGVTEQNQFYSGIFTDYTETVNDGYLTYTITGISHAVEVATAPVNIETFMKRLKYGYHYYGGGQFYDIYPDQTMKPSDIVERLVKDAASGVRACFENYDIDIVHLDEPVDVKTINIDNGCLHDVFFGKSNTDQTKSPSGLVYYSYIENENLQNISLNDYLTDREIELSNAYQMLITHGASSQVTSEMKEAYNKSSALFRIPYICYYDNVIQSISSNKRGTFHYVPKYNKQATNIFNYIVGNSTVESDVLDFSVTFNGASAMASIPRLDGVNVSIDVNGELIGSNNNVLQNDGFIKQSYNTLSGFDESVFLTDSVIADALSYPYKANMTIVGQTECNQLLDCIVVNVYFNGLLHPGLSGEYTIIGIEDNLSSNGFTTTFELVRRTNVVTSEDLPNIVGNAENMTSKAYYNNMQLVTTT